MKLIKIVVLSVAFCLLIFIIAKCDSTEPPIEAQGLVLKLEDVSCTEVWIELSTINLQLPATVTLKQNNQTKKIISLVNPDSLLFIDSLLPNTNYTFQSFAQQINQNEVTSNELSVTTMDTTSHNFTFETFTFGDISNSYLFDVSILNENNIWAVGEIRIADTSATGYTKYNAVHWDGNEWTLHRIMFYTICGQQSRTPYPASSVFAFSENDVWVAMYGDQVARLDGTTQITTICLPISFSIKKIWGENPNSVYAVGDMGKIVHYQNGIGWQVIESGTDVDFLDVWGTPDGSIVWACGETIYKTVLVKIENNQANVVFEGTYPMPQIKNRFSDGLLSLCTNDNRFIYVLSPYNLYRCENNTTGEGQELYPYDDYFKGAYLRIRGTAINNLFTSGNKSTITHFNGSSWRIYDELRNEDQLLRGLDADENLLVTVGEKFENTLYYKAIIILGKK